ncbi:UNVERIFIED_CONTAM: hypothetical protein FKN15_022966 [Acipenser sinensis]
MPVTTNNADGIRPPLHEQISELQRKIQLLEGDRKAYYESSQWTIKKNKESILQLRKENKKLHKKLADTLANLRSLENRLEKAQLKCQEAEHIMKVYLKLKEHLQEESLTFQNKLDSMEAEILRQRQELRELQGMNSDAQLSKDAAKEESLTFQNKLDSMGEGILRQRQELRELQGMNSDAQLSKDAAKAELQHQEEVVYRERRQRDKILNELRKQAEERKAQAERVERRAQRAIMQPDDQSTEAQRSGVDEENTITTFEEAFERIKEATGVTNTQEVVERFISQGDTQRHLELLKVENEKTLERLKEEREKLQADFQEMKYSGEAKLSSGQQVLEEFASHLREEEKRRDEAREHLDRLTRVLSTVRAGVEHLGDKLQHVKIPRGHVPAAQLPPSSEEYVLELLSVSEQKLLQLLEELQGKELNDILLVSFSLPEDEVSSDEDPDVISRTALKRQSQQIIDSRTKRKTRPKKKKGKQ